MTLEPQLPYTLLVVDDEDLVLAVTEAVLTRCGATVYRARDAEGALAIVDNHCKTLDCALIDLNLVGMGGLALAAKLRLMCGDLPLLFMSGDSDARPDLGDPRASFVGKPFRRDELLAALTGLLGQR